MKASEEVKLEIDRLRQQPYPSTVKNIYDVNAQSKIAYINAQSLYRHKMDVEHDFNLSNADVLFCSETKFEEIDAKLLTEICGMYSFRNDAVERGTQRPPYVIAVYYNPHLMQQPPTIANMNGVEILVCSVKRESDNTIKVMAVYKPPAIPLHCLLGSLYSAVRNHYADGELIIMWDFNVLFQIIRHFENILIRLSYSIIEKIFQMIRQYVWWFWKNHQTSCKLISGLR